MRPRAVMVAGALAVAALAWLLSGPAPRRSALPALPSHPNAVQTGAPGAVSEPPAAPARVAIDLDQQGDLAVARTLCIEAVFADDDRPAAGAEVLYWPPRTDARRASDMQRWRDSGDLEAALRQCGRVAITDDRGRASIEADNGSELAVRCGAFYAEAELTVDAAPPLPQRVRLHRDVTLHVLVTDPEQHPLPGIVLTAYAQLASRVFGTDRERALELGCSDATGLLTVPHLQQHLPLPAADVVDWSMQLGVEAMHLWDARRTVTAGELTAAAPIHVVLPAGGTVEVRVVDADGSIVPSQSGPGLIDAESHAAYTPTSREYDPWQYAQVPLGRTLQLMQGTRVAATFAGPKQVGEVVHQRLQLEQRSWRVRGRVRRADGIDLAGAALHFEMAAVPAGAAVARGDVVSRLGPQGGFDLAFALEAAVRAARVRLSVDGVAIALDRELAPGINDLGDLLVQPPAAEVRLATVRVRSGGRDITAAARLDVLTATRSGPRTIPVHRQRDGDRILLRGVKGDRPLRLGCHHPDCLPADVPFEAGADLDVELQPAARLWLSIEPPSLPQPMLRVTLCPFDLAGAEQEGGGAGWGRWSFEGLHPGHYRLRIAAADRVLCEVPALDLRAGDNFFPADRSRLELRGTARAIHIGARDAAGRSIAAECLVVPTGATALAPDWGDRLVDGWIVLPEEPIDVLLRAPGCVPVRVVRPQCDAIIAMPRNVVVRLVAPDGERCEVDVEVVHDGLGDALLPRFDESNQHTAMTYTTSAGPHEICATPGTELRVRTRRGEAVGAWQHFVVAERGPQDLLLR